MKNCSVESCSNVIGKHGAKGYCAKHYKRFRSNGDPNALRVMPSRSSNAEALRFHGWSITDSGCWEWNGHRDPDGYGSVTRGRRPYRAHRLAYETFVGAIPEGHVICHRCDNPPCMNPDHLFIGTPRDNTLDASQKDRMARDERHGQCKLASRDVLRLRMMYATRKYTQRELAMLFGISQAQVNNILLGKQRRRSAVPECDQHLIA